jgi:hypothetical protein
MACRPGNAPRLNSPISARQRVENMLKVRAGGEMAEATQRTSPVAMLKQQLAERDREIAQLKALRREGLLFDLKNDTVKDIGTAVVGTVSEGRALNIADAIKNAVKAKRSKPAG